MEAVQMALVQVDWKKLLASAFHQQVSPAK
jgi:hypothetical protein